MFKVWIDMKLTVKQRLAHNKLEAAKTGGGPFNRYVLTPIDEQVAVICGLYASVDGVKSTKSFGVQSNNNDVLPTQSLTETHAPTPMSPLTPLIEVCQNERISSKTSTPKTSAQVCSRKRRRTIPHVADVMEMESKHFAKISANLEKIREEVKENKNHLKEISRNIRELKRLKEKELKKLTRHHYVEENSLKTTNELKLKFLELERMKLGLQPLPSP